MLNYIDQYISDSQLNGKINYLVKALANANYFYGYKNKYADRKYNAFTKWLCANYYHYRSTYNRTWAYLDMYTRRHEGKLHKMQYEFDNFMVIPQGIPIVERWEYKNG